MSWRSCRTSWKSRGSLTSRSKGDRRYHRYACCARERAQQAGSGEAELTKELESARNKADELKAALVDSQEKRAELEEELHGAEDLKEAADRLPELELRIAELQGAVAQLEEGKWSQQEAREDEAGGAAGQAGRAERQPHKPQQRRSQISPLCLVR